MSTVKSAPIGGMAAAGGGGDPPENRKRPFKPDSTDSPSPSKKLSTKACDNCRRRRVRCDEEQPCHSCQARGDTCLYNDVEKKRGPKGGWPVVRASMQALADRVPLFGDVYVATMLMLTVPGSDSGGGNGTNQTIWQNSKDLENRLQVGERIRDTPFGQFGHDNFNPESPENIARLNNPRTMRGVEQFVAYLQTLLEPGDAPLEVLERPVSQATVTRQSSTRGTRATTRVTQAAQTGRTPLPTMVPQVSSTSSQAGSLTGSASAPRLQETEDTHRPEASMLPLTQQVSESLQRAGQYQGQTHQATAFDFGPVEWPLDAYGGATPFDQVPPTSYNLTDPLHFYQGSLPHHHGLPIYPAAGNQGHPFYPATPVSTSPDSNNTTTDAAGMDGFQIDTSGIDPYHIEREDIVHIMENQQMLGDSLASVDWMADTVARPSGSQGPPDLGLKYWQSAAMLASQILDCLVGALKV